MTTRNAIESSVIQTTDGVTLNARIFKPTQERTDTTETTTAPASGTVIVLVHPYSKLGGCQGLMQGIALRLSIKGFTAITFDMRGVGRSTGRSSLTGFAEIQDVIAVCTWVSQNLPSRKILLVGSSAGYDAQRAPIVGSAVDQKEEIIGSVSIGYPFGLVVSLLFGRHYKAILQSPKPRLFVMGTRDEFTSVKQLENKLKSATGRVQTHLLKGVGHFQMEGAAYDTEMVELILGFLATL